MSADEFRSVNIQQIHEAHEAAVKAVRDILTEVNAVQTDVGNFSFAGENTEILKTEMDDKIKTRFVPENRSDIDLIMQAVTQNANAVCVPLGAETLVFDIGAQEDAVAANTKGLETTNQTHEIDPGAMKAFGDDVNGHFDTIAGHWRTLEGSVLEGTPQWTGPEKEATRSVFVDNMTSILGAVGGEGGEGNGVLGLGDSLRTWLYEQAKPYELQAAGGGGTPATTG